MVSSIDPKQGIRIGVGIMASSFVVKVAELALVQFECISSDSQMAKNFTITFYAFNIFGCTTAALAKHISQKILNK